MTCKDCIHCNACHEMWLIAVSQEDDFFERNDAETCEDFKNKVDYVEVVRCRDCKYLYCFSAIDRQFYCKHFPKGLQGINIVEENPFCSYGERREA